VVLVASLEAFTSSTEGAEHELRPKLGHGSRVVPVARREVLARPGVVVGDHTEVPSLQLGSNQY